MNPMIAVFTLLIGWVVTAEALTIITNSATITTTINDSVRIGSLSGSSLTNPVVTLASGGQINGTVEILEGILRISGGSANGLFVDNYSGIDISSGTVGPTTILRNFGRVDMTGGSIQGELEVSPDSVSTSLRGGTISSLDIQGGAVTVATEITSACFGTDGRLDVIRGGYSPQYYPEGVGEFHLRGGLRSSDTLLFSGNSTIYVYGTNLATDFVATNVVAFFTTSTQYRLTGILQDGTVMTNVPYYIEKGFAPTIFLVQTNVDFPTVSIASNDDSLAYLAWPHPSFGYVAQVSTNFGNLSAPVDWSDIPGSPYRLSTMRFQAATVTADRSVFRLISR